MKNFNLLSYISHWASKPFNFEVCDLWLKAPGIKVLDVGCGNGAPSRMKKHYPEIAYHGLDCTSEYYVNSKDVGSCNKFWLIDLNKKSDISQLPDNYYDLIMMSHVLEHLENGDLAVAELFKKVKKGGIIYIETPSEKSVNLPSMSGTLNFYDDPTHVSLWKLEELKLLVESNGGRVLKAGIRRSKKRIVLLPVYFIRSLLIRKPMASIFWDITGFAHFLLVQK